MAKSRSLTASSEFSAMRLEAQAFGHEGAVDREGRSRQRRGAQREAVDAAARIEQALAVAFEHLDVGEQVVAERHGLRHLQVREARHDGRCMALGLCHQRTLQGAQ